MKYLGTVRTVAKRYRINLPKFIHRRVLNLRVYTKDLLLPYYYMGCYSTLDKTIYIDYRVEKFVKDFRHVFIHEVAHAIDFATGKKSSGWHGQSWRKIARKLKLAPISAQGDVQSDKLYDICMKVYNRREKIFFPKGYK